MADWTIYLMPRYHGGISSAVILLVLQKIVTSESIPTLAPNPLSLMRSARWDHWEMIQEEHLEEKG
jgi:hypothetical protein